MRRLRIGVAVAGLLLLAPACEEGPLVDLPGGGNGTGQVSINVLTQTPRAGSPVELQALVQQSGQPQSNIVVNWSVNPSDPTLQFNPATSTTNTQGIALTTLITAANSPQNLTVTATTTLGTGNRTVILQ